MISKWKIDLKATKSSTYMLPILDTQIKFRFLDNLIGSYLFNNPKDLEFSVLYKFSGKEPFIRFEKEMMSHTLFIGHEDYGEYVLYKFRLTEEMQKTMDLYIVGKYSWFPEDHKDAIQDFLKRNGFKNADRVRMILDRDESIRMELERKLKNKIEKGSELTSPPDVSVEIFSDYVKEVTITQEKYEDS